ncbi:MAG: tetratricopeptide repeat protein [Bryobacteraceae bacterium]
MNKTSNGASDGRAAAALEMFEQAHRAQMQGLLDLAVKLYRQSIALSPTAEAYTFLGWTYHFQGKTHEAIEQCKNAIVIDPAYGNPYNDIGAYLIDLCEWDEAVSWLERAIASRRYDAYHYPWYNLGRVYAAQNLFTKARECFEKSLEIEPRYTLAADALAGLKRMIQ